MSNAFQEPSDFARKDLKARRASHPIANSRTLEKDIIVEFYLNSLSEWSATRFTWENLPDSIDERFLETTLFYNGMALFYKDKRFDKFMAVKAMNVGAPNVEHNPTSFRTVAMPGYQSITLGIKNAVPIWARYSRTPEIDIVMLYAQRIAEIDITINMVTRAMRVNKIVSAPRSQQLSLNNIMRQQQQGVDVIYTDETFDSSQVQAFDVGVDPRILPALRDEKNQIWNDAMTLLGIENANQDKKERLVVSEVSANNGQIQVARNAAMKSRQECADRINDMFGLDLKVRWNADVLQEKEMENNGNLHDEAEPTD